jgi:hypothetical protein
MIVIHLPAVSILNTSYTVTGSDDVGDIPSLTASIIAIPNDNIMSPIAKLSMPGNIIFFFSVL